MAEGILSYCLRAAQRDEPVVEDGRIVGILTLADVSSISQSRWSYTRVGNVMTRAPLLTLAPDDGTAQALRLLSEHSINQAPVLDGDMLVGMVTREDVIRHIQRGELQDGEIEGRTHRRPH